jgi:phosphoglycolate phosphatase
MTVALAALDIAGTTVDEGGAVYRVLARVARAHGGQPTDADVRAWMGADKREAIAALLGVPTTDPSARSAHREFVVELAKAYADTPPMPLPGVLPALSALREAGIRVALTTGFDRQVADPLLAALGWAVPQVLDAVVCADEVAAGRPAPYMILRAMELTGVTDRSRVVVAGDTVLDIRAGQAVGVGMVIGVRSGAQSATELAAARPTRLLDSVADLPDLLGIPTMDPRSPSRAR